MSSAPPPPPPSPVPPPPPPPAAAGAQIHDLSMSHVQNRRGLDASVMALARHVMRRLLGLRRKFRYKLVPLAVVAIAYLPAIAFIGLAALLPDQLLTSVLPRGADAYISIQAAVVLFVALSAPQTLCPDRRHRTLGLYMASPLDRTTYLAANAGALLVVLLVVTLGPPLLTQIGFLVVGAGGPGPLLLVWQVGASGLTLSAVLGALGLAAASLTDRPAFAAAATFLAISGLGVIGGVLVGPLGLPASAQLVDVLGVSIELVHRIYGDTAYVNAATPVVVLAAMAWTAAMGAVVWWRYRRLEIVR